MMINNTDQTLPLRQMKQLINHYYGKRTMIPNIPGYVRKWFDLPNDQVIMINDNPIMINDKIIMDCSEILFIPFKVCCGWSYIEKSHRNCVVVISHPVHVCFYLEDLGCYTKAVSELLYSINSSSLLGSFHCLQLNSQTDATQGVCFHSYAWSHYINLNNHEF